MSAAVRPVFTVAQARAIRLALRCYLEWEDNEPSDVRAMTNALRQLDAACAAKHRRARTS